MAETTYSYDITSDLPGGKVNPSRLKSEIEISSITTALSRIDTLGGTGQDGVIVGGNLDIVFNNALSTSEKTTLDGNTTNPAGGLLADHSNTKSTQEIFVFGTEEIYNQVGDVSALEVQYARVWLPKNKTIDRMQCLVTDVSGSSKQIILGIYTQVDSLNGNAEPSTKVAETAATIPSKGSLTTISLATSYTTATTGYHWLAFLRSSAGGSFTLQQSQLFPANFLPVRRQSVGSFTLPTTPTSLTNPNSAIVYVAALEQN